MSANPSDSGNRAAIDPRELERTQLPCPVCDGSFETQEAAAFDCRAFRDALGSFATGIAVVTACAPGGEFIGLTVNSFNSVSLDPPLVLWSLDSNSPSREAFERASHFVVNILAVDQMPLSQRFATRADDKFAVLELCIGAGGAPLLPVCCAWFECANEIRHPGGDHLIFIGRVARFSHDSARSPLLYHAGRYRALAQD